MLQVLAEHLLQAILTGGQLLLADVPQLLMLVQGAERSLRQRAR
jgi:hypothetical protein